MIRELLWSGHLFDLSGYATANRALLFRAANHLVIQITHDGLQRDPILTDRYTQERLRAHAVTKVGPKAPFLRFYVPVEESQARLFTGRYRICFTMMETVDGVHPDFAARINEYDECWTPTAWGVGMMQEGGVDIPIRQVPLGVDPLVFRPGVAVPGIAGGNTPARLITTGRAGEWEHPTGFKFLTVGQPTFRKGFDFLIRAFGKAFGDDEDVSLTIMTSIHQDEIEKTLPEVKREVERCPARVYQGVFGSPVDEVKRDVCMASYYGTFDAYVTASVGEGWNLPMCEAAACGLPVIASRIGAHEELLEDGYAWKFSPAGHSRYPTAEKLCHWYENQWFEYFNENSLEELVAALREVRENGPDVAARAERLGIIMRNEWTWDRAAATLVKRIMSLDE